MPARGADRDRTRARRGGLLALRPDHFIHIGISRRASRRVQARIFRKTGRSDANG
jgi:hypothetical protein